MTAAQLAETLEFTTLVEASTESPVEGCYVGDLLSWVMGRAKENQVWITVMGNVNAVAVAKLADLSAIILCENATLDDEAAARAAQQNISIYASHLPAYELAVAISSLI